MLAEAELDGAQEELEALEDTLALWEAELEGAQDDELEILVELEITLELRVELG